MAIYGIAMKAASKAPAKPATPNRFAANAKKWAKGALKKSTSSKLYGDSK